MAASGGWGAWLTDQLAVRGWSQSELVRRSGGALSTPQVSRWIRRGEAPTPESVRAVCVALSDQPQRVVSPVLGMVAAGYLTTAELAAVQTTVIEGPARGAHSLDDRELLDELAVRLERGRARLSVTSPLRRVAEPHDPATEGARWAARRHQD